MHTTLEILVVVGVALAGLSASLVAADGRDQPADSQGGVGAARGSQFKVDAVVEPPAVIAVRFHHDGCPYCRAFSTQFPELLRETRDDSVLWVKLDLTNETTQAQAALLAGALGLEHIWPGDLSKIGSVTLLDGESRRVLSHVETANAKETNAALRDALRASRGER